MPLSLIRRPGSDNWYLRGTIKGQSIYETTGIRDKAKAEEWRAQREAELYDAAIYGAKATVLFDDAALSYLEFTPRSIATEKYVHRLIQHFSSTRLARIDQSAAEQAVARIVGNGAAPATKIRAVYTPLTAVLTFAHGRGWCDVPRFHKPTPPDGKTRWLTPREAARLIESASPHLRPLLHFLFCTGARLAEALDLEWSDIDLSGAQAIFRGIKARAGQRRNRITALTPAIIGTLGTMTERTGRVFRNHLGEPYADRHRLEGGQIKTAFATACERAELADVTPHDLRHTWATWFYGASKDLLLLKDEGAWRTLRMVERYAHLMPAGLVPEIATIWGASHPRIGVLPTVTKSVQSDPAQQNSA